ncbi:hypothetical protein [uncultured Methylovirgula sp.]|uniref:hypothetical protein n=1 Tax=uncultured Methylovirgula sp. TaxID=1285960 RepID=UPI002611405E|nr:hypothetical protein [uncultured Methylovirgula sp.]
MIVFGAPGFAAADFVAAVLAAGRVAFAAAACFFSRAWAVRSFAAALLLRAAGFAADFAAALAAILAFGAGLAAVFAAVARP